MPKKDKEKPIEILHICENCHYFKYRMWCYRYPQIALKSKKDFCGEWLEK